MLQIHIPADGAWGAGGGGGGGGGVAPCKHISGYRVYTKLRRTTAQDNKSRKHSATTQIQDRAGARAINYKVFDDRKKENTIPVNADAVYTHRHNTSHDIHREQCPHT